MDFGALLKTTQANQLVLEAEQIAVARGIEWKPGMRAILAAGTRNPKQAPNLARPTREGLLEAWLRKYEAGYNGRISQRASNLPGTISDPIVDTIIQARFPRLTPMDVSRIRYGHRLGMSAENILGLLLEEYLANGLAEFGWHCCWGETLRSIDFVSEDLHLLQIKNRSNSENSSSSRVRARTRIKKWFRVNALNGTYNWDELNRVNRTVKFSEDDFVAFVQATLRSNPEALAIEPGNPWMATDNQR